MLYLIFSTDRNKLKKFKQLKNFEFIPFSKLLYYEEKIKDLENKNVKLIKEFSKEFFTVKKLTDISNNFNEKNLKNISTSNGGIIGYFEKQYEHFKEILLGKTKMNLNKIDYDFIEERYIKIVDEIKSNELLKSIKGVITPVNKKAKIYKLYYIKDDNEFVTEELKKYGIEEFKLSAIEIDKDKKDEILKESLFIDYILYYIGLKFYRGYLQSLYSYGQMSNLQYAIVWLKDKCQIKSIRKKLFIEPIVIKMFDENNNSEIKLF